MKYFKKIYIFLYYLFILGVLFSQNYYADNNVQFFKSLHNNNNSNLDCDDSDLNIDGIVDIFDIYIILNCILSNDCIECVDINQDYYVNVIDIIIIIDIINNPVVTVEDIDGNIYRIININNKIWMAENLKVTRYNNGDSITYIHDSNVWNNFNHGHYTIYNNDFDHLNNHGYLYNWNAVNDERGICPIGYHVPTDIEWSNLISYLDSLSNPEAENHDEYESYIAGGILKSTGTIDDGNGYWYQPNLGATDSLGFSSNASGVIPDQNGNTEFHGYYLGYIAFYWTSTEISNIYAWSRELSFMETTVHRHSIAKNYGMSVRCISD